jgi:malate/lactate dehydrogenase
MRGYRVNPEGEDDRLTEKSLIEYKKEKTKEFNFIYNGPPIKIKRGFEKVTEAQRREKEREALANSHDELSPFSRTETFSYRETKSPAN